MSRTLFVAVVLSCFAFACQSEQSGSAPAGANTGAPAGAQIGKPAEGATADAPCDAVVAKLASFDSSAGDAEKKLWTKMCADMPPAMRACIVASKTKEERDVCDKGGKPIK